MTIEVIIPTCNRAEPCLNTIQNILKNARDKIDKIVIVENGVKSDLEKKILNLNDAKVEYHYIREGNKSLALNYALKFVSEEAFIIFFDDDIEVLPNTVKAYVDASKNIGRGYYYGGPTEGIYQSPPPPNLTLFLPASVKGLVFKPRFHELDSKLKFLGFNWAIFKKDLDLISGFDIRFGPGSTTGATGQETKAMKDLAHAGIKAYYLEEAKVYHFVKNDQYSLKWIIYRSYRQGIESALSNDCIRIIFFEMNPFFILARIVKHSIISRKHNLQVRFLYILTIASHHCGVLKGILVGRLRIFSKH